MKTHTDTEGGRPCEDGGRDWSDTATSQGMPGATRSWKGQERILPQRLDFKLLASGTVRE